MDRSVEPCDDFYKYSCGGWMSKQLIPEYSPSYTTFSELGDAMRVQLKCKLSKDICDCLFFPEITLQMTLFLI